VELRLECPAVDAVGGALGQLAEHGGAGDEPQTAGARLVGRRLLVSRVCCLFVLHSVTGS
jgi:hypothetical protein